MSDLLDHLELLEWLPDETLFSLVSRLHRFWGFSLAGQTCEVLFGHHQQGSQHDLPSRLGAFVSRVNQRYGTAADLANLHTLLAYYRPFVGAGLVDEAVHAMATESVAHLKLRLGMLTSRFRANHPLKACPCCIGEDIKSYGWSYWHLVHQYPGVWVCLKHGCWLRMSSLKATGVGRFQWVLPNLADFHEPFQSEVSAFAEPLTAPTGLAQLIVAVSACKDPWVYTSDLLLQVYRLRLRELGWMTLSGRVRWPVVTESYCRYVQPLLVCPDVPRSMQMADKVVVQLGRMLRGARGGTHPLRHFLIIHFLYGAFEKFDAAVRRLASPALSAAEIHLSNESCGSSITELESRCFKLREVLADGCTISCAARALGVDVGTAMAWAAKMNIPVLRRAKTLKVGVRDRAVGMLRSGADKAVVANEAGVSVQTISRLILTEVGLHAQWRLARFESQRARNRTIWVALTNNYVGAGIKILRAMEPATFAWLYRHDRVWMVDHRPQLARHQTRDGASRVDWCHRDRLLSADVLAMGERLALQDPGKRIKLWQIYQGLPELKAKLGALDKLPLTRSAVEFVIAARNCTHASLFEKLIGM